MYHCPDKTEPLFRHICPEMRAYRPRFKTKYNLADCARTGGPSCAGASSPFNDPRPLPSLLRPSPFALPHTHHCLLPFMSAASGVPRAGRDASEAGPGVGVV